jgi:hypothetical protein
VSKPINRERVKELAAQPAPTLPRALEALVAVLVAAETAGELVSMARLIVANRGTELTTHLSDILRPRITGGYAAMVKRLEAEEAEE